MRKLFYGPCLCRHLAFHVDHKILKAISPQKPFSYRPIETVLLISRKAVAVLAERLKFDRWVLPWFGARPVE